MRRKISIVFEETGAQGGKGFNVYLSGHDREISKIPAEQRSPAEWWSFKIFGIVASLMGQAGVVQSVFDGDQKKGSEH